jgi:hypothetical protein
VAIGPRGRQLVTSFDADVVEPPAPPEKEEKGPRLVDGEFKTGSMRRPPYELKTITRDQYGQPCWNAEEWTDEDAGAFLKPTERSPLILIINQDLAALRDFRQCKARVFAVSHRVIAAARSIELVRDHERQRRFLAAIDLPAMIEDMHTRVWR